jgi:hypothetical protein
MADREGIDVPPDLERVFIIEELLEHYGGESVEDPEEQKPKQCPVPLPARYNITYLEVLIRDPLWVFAFWEIKSADRERFENLPDFDSYCLQTLEFDGRGNKKGTAFTIPVGAGDEAWYLGFPGGGGTFTVELCAAFRSGKPQMIAASRPFTLPRLFDPNDDSVRRHFSRLSGSDGFPVLRDSPCLLPRLK